MRAGRPRSVTALRVSEIREFRFSRLCSVTLFWNPIHEEGSMAKTSRHTRILAGMLFVLLSWCCWSMYSGIQLLSEEAQTAAVKNVSQRIYFDLAVGGTASVLCLYVLVTGRVAKGSDAQTASVRTRSSRWTRYLTYGGIGLQAGGVATMMYSSNSWDAMHTAGACGFLAGAVLMICALVVFLRGRAS